MIIESDKSKPAFVPVTITITIQSQDELDGLTKLFGNQTTATLCDTSLGSVNFKDDKDVMKVAEVFLKSFYTALRKQV